MDNSGVIGIVALIISVIGTIITAINHKRIRSNCCGHRIEASIDIEESSPRKTDGLHTGKAKEQTADNKV